MGPETEGLNCFYCTMLNFERKLPKAGTMSPLRKDTNASRDQFRPMGAHQNLALCYKLVNLKLAYRPFVYFLALLTCSL